MAVLKMQDLTITKTRIIAVEAPIVPLAFDKASSCAKYVRWNEGLHCTSLTHCFDPCSDALRADGSFYLSLLDQSRSMAIHCSLPFHTMQY